MNESYHTYEWVMSHISMSHITTIHEPYHTHNCSMSHVSHVAWLTVAVPSHGLPRLSVIYRSSATLHNVWHDAFMCVTWLIYTCDMTHSYVWRDMCDIRTCSYVWHSYVWHYSCMFVTWLTVAVPSHGLPRLSLIYCSSATLHNVMFENASNEIDSETAVLSLRESCRTYEWGVSHVWMSHSTHVNEACHTYTWGMSHIYMRHVTHMNDSCHTYEWGMSHIWMSHFTHMNESCHTYEWGMSHIWMSRVTHMNESCHTYGWVMSHIWMRHVTHTNELCLFLHTQ